MNKKNYFFNIPLENRVILGTQIKLIREDKKVTLTDISDLSKIGVSDLHKIEHGTKIRINPLQLKALGLALNIDYKIFYKIVGFLDEEDFNFSKDNSLVKNELKNFQIELLEKFLKDSKGKVSEANLKEVLKILLNLSDEKIKSWIFFGKFLLFNLDNN